MVTIWVTNVVLHVADNDVLPVSYVQCAVFTDNRVSRPEVSVVTVDDVLNGSSPNLAETTFVTRSPVVSPNFNAHGCNQGIVVKKFNFSIIETVFESFAIPDSEFGDFNRFVKFTFHPRIHLYRCMGKSLLVSVGKQCGREHTFVVFTRLA